MIKHLYIKNFTLIDELDIDFYSGFSVISGETGAGKSIILGAIGLLLGNRADIKQIKQGEKKCVIEATFDLSNYNFFDIFETNEIEYDSAEAILRREINDNGKSRAFVNDTPVSLNVIKEIGSLLVDIHSQHQNLLLQKEDFQLNVIDLLGETNKTLTLYQAAYSDYKKASESLEELKVRLEKNKENEDLLRFQLNELETANLKEGNLEEWEEEVKTLSHAEDIKMALYEGDSLLNGEDRGVIDQLKRAKETIHRIIDVYPKAQEIVQRLETTYIELKDIGADLDVGKDDIEFDPERLNFITEQLDHLYSLQKKYCVDSVAQLIELKEDIQLQLSSIDNSEEELLNAQKKLDIEKERCSDLAAKLTAQRKKGAKNAQEEMKRRLIPMGIPNVQFEIDLQPKTLSRDGADSVQFLFSANKSTPVQPISQVASGGEIARVMLSLKAMISKATHLPTIIFDEIDTGVSGKVAEQMAMIMKEMGATERQVLAITHLPQIAALGTTHYKVEKTETEKGTISKLRLIEGKDRVNEIAQMLSGADITDAAIANAKQLLNM